MTAGPDGSQPAQWGDLRRRLVSGFALGGSCLLAAWAGGALFGIFVAAAVGVCIWELARMAGSDAASPLACLSGAVCLAVALLPAGWGLPLLMVPVLASSGRVPNIKLAFAVFALMIVLAGYGLILLRAEFGLIWLSWLVAVVMVTDILGYFAGRTLGGPKFWPAVSPKKTWSGTVAGWLGSAAVGAVFVSSTGVGWEVLAISVAASMASQFGDIAESALKRRVGFKDSSTLLPGHGGFFDRFDGVLGAAIFLLLVRSLVDFPPAPV